MRGCDAAAAAASSRRLVAAGTLLMLLVTLGEVSSKPSHDAGDLRERLDMEKGIQGQGNIFVLRH